MSALVHRRTATPAEAADWDSRRQLLTNIRGIGGRAYPRVSGILRERTWLFFETVLPFLTTAGFVFVYRTLQAPPQYIGFVVLGGAMTAFWLNVMWMMAAQLHWERDQGNLELYFTAPVSMMSILLGMAVGGLVMSGVRAAIVLPSARSCSTSGSGRPVGPAPRDVPAHARRPLRARDGPGEPVPGLGPRGLSPDRARHRAHLLRVRASTSRSAAWASWAAWRSRSCRSPSGSTRCASSRSWTRPVSAARPPPAVEALILVVMTVVFISLARWMLAALERRARRDGRLTSRWQ